MGFQIIFETRRKNISSVSVIIVMLSLLPCLHVPTASTVPVMLLAHSQFLCSVLFNKYNDVDTEAIVLALKENYALTSGM